jgi:hypothetical protein
MELADPTSDPAPSGRNQHVKQPQLPYRATATIVVFGALDSDVPDGSGDRRECPEIIRYTTTFETSDLPTSAAAKWAVESVQGDAADFFNGSEYDKYERSGYGLIEVTIEVSDEQAGFPSTKTIQSSIRTSGSLGRALRKGIYAACDQAGSWITSRDDAYEKAQRQAR